MSSSSNIVRIGKQCFISNRNKEKLLKKSENKPFLIQNKNLSNSSNCEHNFSENISHQSYSNHDLVNKKFIFYLKNKMLVECEDLILSFKEPKYFDISNDEDHYNTISSHQHIENKAKNIFESEKNLDQNQTQVKINTNLFQTSSHKFDHFICLRITNHALLHEIQKIQHKIVSELSPNKNFGLNFDETSSILNPISGMHITLCLLRLNIDENYSEYRDRAKLVLSKFAEEIEQDETQTHTSKNMYLNFRGILKFDNCRVIYGGLDPNDKLRQKKQLYQFSIKLCQYFEENGIQCSTNSHFNNQDDFNDKLLNKELESSAIDFEPHITLFRFPKYLKDFK